MKFLALTIGLLILVQFNMFSQCVEIVAVKSNGSGNDSVVGIANGDIMSGSNFYLTDNNWSFAEKKFSTAEDIITYTANSNIPSGTRFLLYPPNSAYYTSSSTGTLVLNDAGDAIYTTITAPSNMNNGSPESSICFNIEFGSAAGVNAADTVPGKFLKFSADNGVFNASYQGTMSLTNVSNWTLNSSSSINIMSALPITLKIPLIGKIKNNEIKLSWTTSSETNNSHFYINHGGDLDDINTITTIRGAGTSLNENEYAFTHKNPKQGSNYYQLIQVDYDGTETAYDVITVEYQPTLRSKIYPSITPGLLNIEPKASELIVYNIMGKKIAKFENINQIDLSHLPKGVYLLSSENQISKIILNK